MGVSYSCRATEWPFWFGTIAPFITVYIFNWVMFVTIMVSICKHTKSMNNSGDEKGKISLQSTRKNAVAAMTLAIVFGLGWAFGLVVSIPVAELSFAFQILFCFTVGSQGVLILLLHGIRNKDFRDFWAQLYNVIDRKTHLSSIITSARSTLLLSPTLQHSTTEQDSTALSTLPKKDLSKGTACPEKSVAVESAMDSCSADDKTFDVDIQFDQKCR